VVARGAVNAIAIEDRERRVAERGGPFGKSFRQRGALRKLNAEAVWSST